MTVPDVVDEFHFEGPEKKLDLSFACVQGDGLRRVPQSVWQQVCKDAKCSILHRESNATFDAYLLSESSLFVFPDRVIAKTCGQTTLLNMLPHLFTLAEMVGTKPTVLTYGHFRYRFPDEQEAPHRSFETEHDHLARLFPGVGKASTLAGGDAYAVDASARCWHVYVADLRAASHLTTRANAALFAGFVPAEGLEAIRGLEQASDDARSSADSTAAPASPSELRGHGYETPLRMQDSSDAFADERDGAETVLEVAMEGLSARFAAHFFFDGVAKRAAEPHACARDSGIEALMPGVTLDPWCFEPCGFSLNGLRDGYYFTIHITPEPQMSFGSFETNDPRYATKGFVQALLATFEPEHAAVLVTARAADGAPAPLADCADALVGYRQLRATQDKFGPAIGARCTVIEKRALLPPDRA